MNCLNKLSTLLLLFAFNISADQSQLKGFELQYTGSDEENSAQKGDAAVKIYDADSVKVYDISSKYSNHGIRIWKSDDALVDSFSVPCVESDSKRGLHAGSSNGLQIKYGDFSCTSDSGIFLNSNTYEQVHLLSIFDALMSIITDYTQKYS